MRAMMYRVYGGPLELVDIPRPAAGPGQLLVRVIATSVNPVDWKVASGKMRPIMSVTRPCVPGLDIAGEVVEVGTGGTGTGGRFTVGERVHARIAGLQGGGAAEFAVVGGDVTAPMPEGMDPGEAAGLPLAGMTALQGLRDALGIPMTGATQRILVVGASGGVGHLAVQIARAAGASVVGVCSARNAALVASLGAQQVIDYTKPDAYRGLAPFDAVYDCVGGDPGPFLPLLTSGGQYASCVPGPKLLLRSLLNVLSARKVKPVMLKGTGGDLRVLDALVSAGRLRVVVDRRYRLEAMQEAWDRSKSGRAAGKIVVDVA